MFEKYLRINIHNLLRGLFRFKVPKKTKYTKAGRWDTKLLISVLFSGGNNLDK